MVLQISPWQLSEKARPIPDLQPSLYQTQEVGIKTDSWPHKIAFSQDQMQRLAVVDDTNGHGELSTM